MRFELIRAALTGVMACPAIRLDASNPKEELLAIAGMSMSLADAVLERLDAEIEQPKEDQGQ